MEDRQDEVLKQYDFKVHNKYRARGAVLLDTNRGLLLFKSFEGSTARLSFENHVKKYLMEQDYRNVDYIMPNLQGEMVSLDATKNKYIVKNWFAGEECNLMNEDNAKKAAANLAVLHKMLRNVPLEGVDPFYDNLNIDEIFDKHNKELKRVRGYIRDKNNKNEFEVCILNSFDEFFDQARNAVEMIQKSSYHQMCEEARLKTVICHGSYTYHNVLLVNRQIATTNFEKCNVGMQIFDLYYFLRKAMEKNEWRIDFGQRLIREYTDILVLSKQELEFLYILLLYPEKYWKIINYYFNNKKSWLSQRNIEKLIGVREQKVQRDAFLARLL